MHVVNNVVSVFTLALGFDALEARVPHTVLGIAAVALAAVAALCLRAVRRGAAGWTPPRAVE